jgi:hypothetical protein
MVEPDDGGEELCSLAPPEVSALPDGGTVAELDASGDVVLVVGGLVGVSAARTGAIAMDSVNAVSEIRRIMSLSFLPHEQRFGFVSVSLEVG